MEGGIVVEGIASSSKRKRQTDSERDRQIGLEYLRLKKDIQQKDLFKEIWT